jgi:hypothetical protein
MSKTTYSINIRLTGLFDSDSEEDQGGGASLRFLTLRLDFGA